MGYEPIIFIMKKTELLIFALCILLVSSCKYLKKEDKLFSTEDEALEINEDEVSKADSLAESDSTEIETLVLETEPIPDPAPSSAPSVGYNSDKYYMVVGSFLSENLAQKYARKMLDKGYQPQVIYSSSMGFYRVSAQSYDDYQTAVSDIQNFRDNLSPRAWVHVKR